MASLKGCPFGPLLVNDHSSVGYEVEFSSRNYDGTPASVDYISTSTEIAAKLYEVGPTGNFVHPAYTQIQARVVYRRNRTLAELAESRLGAYNGHSNNNTEN
jgi:hypothetical protein